MRRKCIRMPCTRRPEDAFLWPGRRREIVLCGSPEGWRGLLVCSPAGMLPSPAAQKTRGAAKRRKQPNAHVRCARTAGQKFTDDRVEGHVAVDWGRGDSHPHLCDDCTAWALEVERQAEQAEREGQKQGLQEAAQVSKTGGWLGRWRS